MLASHTPQKPLRIAIGQLRMEWSRALNTASILRAVPVAAKAGAELCLFPELAVTGFHRRIREELDREGVGACVRAITQACAQHRIAVAVGTPAFGDGGALFNGCLFVSEEGEAIGTIAKVGLTPAEQTVFTCGAGRPTFDLRGRRFSAMLCREVDDGAQVLAQLEREKPQIILWPGAMRPAVDGSETDPDAHVKRAQAMARQGAAFIVQANWANSLNYPDESAAMGRSVVVAPTGEVLLRLPLAEAGLGVLDLGAREFAWQPQDA